MVQAIVRLPLVSSLLVERPTARSWPVQRNRREYPAQGNEHQKNRAMFENNCR